MPKLTLLVGRKAIKVYDVNATVLRIGRDADMDVVIDNVAVSRRQAEIRLDGADWVLRDLGSGNGTFLNGRRLEQSAPLRPGDEISFGKFSLLFERVPAEAVAVAAAGAAPARSAGPAAGTLLLDADEAAELQRTFAQQRRAQLQWKAGDRGGVHYLTAPATLVGRSDLCDLQVPGGPRQHVLVTRAGGSVEIRNLSWWYRMRVNGRAQSRALLRSGDHVEVGDLRLTFLDEVH